MGAITLPNFRTTADVTMNTRLKDGGVSIDWAGLTNIKAWLYSDVQKAIAGRCDVSINQADSTKLVCLYSASKPQYLGIQRLIVQAKYMGQTKTYDVPAFNFVSRTAAATGSITIDEPTVDVSIEVTDISSSIIDDALRAVLAATDEAMDAAALANGKAAQAQARIEQADADHTRAGNDHAQAEADHTQASSDHNTASADHSQAGADHERADSDHGTASTDHSTAEADHTQASSDHSTAAADHTQAGQDHTRAATDHDTAASDHTAAAADHSRAGEDHTTAAADHSQAGTDHSTASEDHTQAQADHAVMAGYDTRLSAVEGDVPELDFTKLDKVVGTNLVNPNTLTPHSYIITSSGDISSGGTDNWSVSDFIPVIDNGVGKNIISNGVAVDYVATYAVYDKLFNVLRTIVNSTQYTYQEGDFYVRIGFNNGNGDKMANYGTTLLPFEPYTDYTPLKEVSKRVGVLEPLVEWLSEQMPQKLDKVPSSNLIDPNKLLQAKYINAQGGVSDGTMPYCVTDYIFVNGSDIISNAYISGSIAYSFAVYDISKTFLRTGATRQYTYQEGDAFIRFTIRYSPGESRANYGTTLLPFEPYTDYKPLTDLGIRVSAVEQQAEQIPDKLDKIVGNNLIDPNALTQAAYINSQGVISSGAMPYCVTAYIPVISDGVGKDIIASATTNSPVVPYAVYDQNKNLLRVGSTTQYTYQEGDAFVRFSIRYSATSSRANYGTTLLPFEPYTEYKPLSDLEARVDAIDGGEKAELTLADINYIYTVFNTQNRNYVSKLDIAHLLSGATFLNKEIYFANGQRFAPIYPVSVVGKNESNVSISVKPKAGYLDTQVAFKQRNTESAASKSVTPRVLVIGDSVTNGYGASSNKAVSWFPNQYWAFAKMFFEMDKIDGGDNAGEYNAIFLGSGTDGGFTIKYGNVTRAVRAKAEAKGGATLDELLTATWGGDGTPNPFYDAINETFSLAGYINKYRTMDDLGVRLATASANPAGETVVGSDGNTYTVGTEIDTQAKLAGRDVCTPSHVVINMTHNTTLANYQSSVGAIIGIIQNELPGVPIVLMTIDETGTYFPIDHPDYVASQITYGGLHTKNLSINQYVHESVEDETNGIYLLGANFIQPPVRGYATIKYEDISFAERGEDAPGLNITNPGVSGANYHPNNYTHEAFGYALYAMLKYLITS